MEFDVNSPVLFVIVAAIIAFVLAQSVFFLVRAVKQGKKLGMSGSVLKRTVVSAITFTIAPAISIFIGVVTMSKKLGIALPWLRLSIIGSLTYELTAAEAGANAVGTSLSDSSSQLTAEQYVTIALVMTVGALLMLLLVPIFAKRIDNGMLKFRKKDKKWGEIFTNALFIGLISAFLGFVFVDVRSGGLEGWIPVFVMLISAALMAVFGIIFKITKWRWITDYALPVSMVAAMALAIPITNAIA